MPAKVEKKSAKGRYIFARLVRQLIALKPGAAHAALLSLDLTPDEYHQLAKRINGVIYHRSNQRNLQRTLNHEEIEEF